MADEIETVAATEESMSTPTSEVSDETVPNPLDSWGEKATDSKTTEAEAEKPEIPADDKESVKEPEKVSEPEKKEPVKEPEPEKTAETPAPEKKDEPEKSDDKPADEDELLDELFEEKDDKDKEDDKEPEKEDLDKLNPDEQLDRQRNKTAKAWAKRRDTLASHVDAFRFDEKPIAEVAQSFEELNKERYAEFRTHAAHSLVDENPEATFQRAYVATKLRQDPAFDYRTATIPTLAEVVNGQVQSGSSIPDADVLALTKSVDDALGFDWRNPDNDGNFLDDRETVLANALRQLEARSGGGDKVTTLESQLTEANAKLAQLEGQVQTAEQLDVQKEQEAEVHKFRSSVEEKLVPRFLKNAGLEITKDDTPEIAAFKKNRHSLYQGTDYERANGLSSSFETFAYHESSVQKELDQTITRIVEAQVKEVNARRAGDSSQATQFKAVVEEQRMPLFNLLAVASKEFKAKHITPYFAAIGTLSSKLTTEINQARERVEVVDSGGDAPTKSKQKSYSTAEDVWGSMVSDAAEEDRLRAAV